MSEYVVHAIKYARIGDRTAAENFMNGDPHNGPMPMDFFVWTLTDGDRTIVVDTGFDHATAARRGRVVSRPVAEGLRTVGVDPGTVADVILTHLHYDHCGNHDLFPQARYHVQEREMRFCTGACMCHSVLRHPFELDDVQTMVKRVFEGRVCFHDGAADIAPGISVHWVGGHSKGLQVVRVRTRRGWVVLASDASHYYANFQQQRPFAIVVDVDDMLNGYATLARLATSEGHIVPGHDPLVLDRYPAAGKGEGIVRLDVEPMAAD